MNKINFFITEVKTFILLMIHQHAIRTWKRTFSSQPSLEKETEDNDDEVLLSRDALTLFLSLAHSQLFIDQRF